ncbi:hypothetical protein Tsubulata_042693 [Turnera subulata]|uniref:non-specific serine/threonine protein kinase n=1 Tax=Turnera subulata TaxID=218843 RepID=A0A9Q0FV82_9ROSI|nr:hypothetical protein Tsubulata_042693 [Turnera subulata]
MTAQLSRICTIPLQCPPALEEHGSLTSNNGAASAFSAGLLVDLDLNTSTPDTYRPPPAPLPYDVVLGCPQSTDSESVRETISRSSFGTLATCEDLEESDCKTQDSSLVMSPKKEISKSTEPLVSTTEEEDSCPICLEEYGKENPKLFTKCEHHFHLSCLLEWMERSDTCPMCDQAAMLNPNFELSLPFFLLLFSFLPLLASSTRILTKLETDQTSNNDVDVVIIRGNSTIQSKNGTFELGFFCPDNESKNWYLGIWYASLPTRIYVWVANRETPISNLTPATALQVSSSTGRLEIKDSSSPTNPVIWQATSAGKATDFTLLETGNLVLLSPSGSLVWQSFDFPTDTWLPGMNVTGETSLVSWKSLNDPSPGMFSLRLNPLLHNEFELVYNKSVPYWRTGNWTGAAFTGVPEMTVPYIYRFHFEEPFTPAASFWYTEFEADAALRPPLTRFQVDVEGQLKQYTWSQQIGSWNMFWSQPDNRCKVHGLCGNLGVCNGSSSLNPCVCVSGFEPISVKDWDSRDFSGGCGRKGGRGGLCDDTDVLMEIGVVGFDGAVPVSFQGSRSDCESSCLSNCSCIGLFYNERTSLCKNLHGSLLNLRKLGPDSTYQDVFYVRVPREGIVRSDGPKYVLLIGGIVGSIGALGLLGGTLLVMGKRRKKRKGVVEDGSFPALNLKVFTYKELYAATRGFSDKLGHGGFGAVFQGELSDSTVVAVKRLERPGSGEKEFRAEVCTIGNIQHINLVRLRGFCSEDSHRLLVYDYMPNGPLSVYLRRDGPNLSWDVRFRIAIGTARGIAYLHEECRDCIVHCDIKPENILLDGDYSAKVSDFGLAKLIGRDFSRVLATMRGTWGYVAPEWISGVAITTKADVYSYGMTLLELLGGRRNVEAPPSANGANGGADGGRESESGDKWFFPPYAAKHIIGGNVATVVDSRLGSEYNTVEAERMALVAVWCIQDDEEMRPTMGMVVKMLEGVVEMGTPPPPKLLQALISGESYPGVQKYPKVLIVLVILEEHLLVVLSLLLVMSPFPVNKHSYIFVN